MTYDIKGLSEIDIQFLDLLLSMGMQQGKAVIIDEQGKPLESASGEILYIAKACVNLEALISPQIREQRQGVQTNEH